VTQFTQSLEVRTAGKGLYPFTSNVAAWLAKTGVASGLLTLFVQHTSASLVIPEDGNYRHSTEGSDDMPAHIRAALTGTHLSIPVLGGRMALGTWQGVYLFEHRADPQRRSVVAHLLGER
jgi:thiamine phosphate synthase YjbQ (UPF0047 family)